MNRREVVINALNHVETDIVPYNAEFTNQEYEKMVDFTSDVNFLDKYGCFLHYFQYWGYPKEIAAQPLFFIDDYGVKWNRSGADRDIGVVDEPIITAPNINMYKQPFLDESKIRKQCEKAIKTKEDKFCFAGLGFSLFERLWSYLGIEDALVYMLVEKEFINELLDKICDYNLKVIDIFNDYPFDGIYFGDDWGQQKGMIMGAPLWREFIKPRLKKMYDRAKKNGKYILQHSCGDIEDVFDDLIEIGLDCYQTFQPEIYDIEKIKQKYGKKLTFGGGISTQRLLSQKKPDEIRDEIRRIKKIMRRGGGYILAPTHAITDDAPEENVLAMLDEFTK